MRRPGAKIAKFPAVGSARARSYSRTTCEKLISDPFRHYDPVERATGGAMTVQFRLYGEH
jgi:hypothetical protein